MAAALIAATHKTLQLVQDGDRNAGHAGQSAGELADLPSAPSRPRRRHARRSELRLLLERPVSPALHLQPPIRVRLCPRLQRRHGALEVAPDNAPPEVHRPWHVQRHGFLHQGGQAGHHLSWPGVRQEPVGFRPGRQPGEVDQARCRSSPGRTTARCRRCVIGTPIAG